MSVENSTARFTRESTAADVLRGHDLHGKTALVTGGTSGLGQETARALAAAGARVFFTGRSARPDERRLARLRAAAGPDAGELAYRQLDLGSLAPVRAFAQPLLGEGPLDILVHSAGVMATPLTRTSDGFEIQFGINHLGHFVLAGALLPGLLAAPAARVVILSSRAHRRSDVSFTDPNYLHRPYDPWEAYGQSKTANALHAVGLAQRWAGQGLTVSSVMPGGIATGLQEHLPPGDLRSLGWTAKDGRQVPPASWKTVEQGAATVVWAAVAPELDGHSGHYLEDCAIASTWTGPDDDVPSGWVAARALDPERAERLWELSARLVS